MRIVSWTVDRGERSVSGRALPPLSAKVAARHQRTGRPPLLAPEEQAAYGFVYALFADVAADEDREQIAWARLRALEGLPNLSGTMRDELRLAL